MKTSKNKIVFLTGLISLALLGLLLLQLYFLKNAKDQKEQAFERNVLIALNNTAQILENNEAVNGIIQLAIADSLNLPGHPEKHAARKYVTTFIDTHSTTGKGKIPPELSVKKPEKGKRTSIGYSISLNVDDSVKSIDTVFTSPGKGKNRIFSVEGQPSGRGMKYFYQYSDDTTEYFVQSYNGKKVRILLNNMAVNRKRNMVSRVMDRLILADQKPIEKRIKLAGIDSLLRRNLWGVGIYIPYRFGIISGQKDSVRMAYAGVNRDELLRSPLRTRLYPNDIFSSPYLLTIDFPGRSILIYKEIAPLLILSFVFIIVIAGSFIYTIRTIYKQKKFSSLIVDFINNMTHEFKTPISTISLASEALSNPAVIEDRNKLDRYNQIIREENLRMRQQVEKILQMAVLEERDYELDIRDVDLHEVVYKAAHNAMLQIEGNGGKVNCTLNALNHIIKADQVHITNIIHNILDNAIKYSPEPASIEILTENKPGSILVSLSDKGIGIKEDDLKNVFDKYYRVPTGNQHDIKGFGLGLSYVKLMVLAHRGNINIKSKEGAGTTVEILLPAD